MAKQEQNIKTKGEEIDRFEANLPIFWSNLKSFKVVGVVCRFLGTLNTACTGWDLSWSDIPVLDIARAKLLGLAA